MPASLCFGSFFFLRYIFKNIYLVVLGLSCSTRVGSSSLTGDRTRAPCIRSAES